MTLVLSVIAIIIMVYYLFYTITTRERIFEEDVIKKKTKIIYGIIALCGIVSIAYAIDGNTSSALIWLGNVGLWFLHSN